MKKLLILFLMLMSANSLLFGAANQAERIVEDIHAPEQRVLSAEVAEELLLKASGRRAPFHLRNLIERIANLKHRVSQEEPMGIQQWLISRNYYSLENIQILRKAFYELIRNDPRFEVKSAMEAENVDRALHAFDLMEYEFDQRPFTRKRYGKTPSLVILGGKLVHTLSDEPTFKLNQSSD